VRTKKKSDDNKFGVAHLQLVKQSQSESLLDVSRLNKTEECYPFYGLPFHEVQFTIAQLSVLLDRKPSCCSIGRTWSVRSTYHETIPKLLTATVANVMEHDSKKGSWLS
jgi:hypothetical protein